MTDFTPNRRLRSNTPRASLSARPVAEPRQLPSPVARRKLSVNRAFTTVSAAPRTFVPGPTSTVFRATSTRYAVPASCMPSTVGPPPPVMVLSRTVSTSVP
jgi:hypothetical protein